MNIYEEKGETFERGSYRGLLDQITKVAEKVFEWMMREKVKIIEMYFGFIPGSDTVRSHIMHDQIARFSYNSNYRIK